MIEKQKVLILGGGFGGIKTALSLCNDERFDVQLVSDQSTFRYYPQLYHAATGGRGFAASIPLVDIFHDKPVRTIHDSAVQLDRQHKFIAGKSGKQYDFDILVIALGVVTNYFGIKGLEQYAYGIKSLEEARRFRNHLHKLLVDKKKPDINYVVIGGGPTGVELAGALPGYIKRIMKNHDIEGQVHVDLVEAAPRLMPRMPVRYSRAAAKRLKNLGVELHLGQTVEAETAEELMVSGHSIESHSVVWTAGVTNHPFLRANNFKLTDHGKAVVNQHLEAEPSIYVIGDNADTEFSGMAQTALHDGKFLAENLSRRTDGSKMLVYEPRQPIYVTPVGEGWAAVLWGRKQIYGHLGWWLHRAAEWVGYHDLEPWWPAGRHWIAASESEDECPVCRQKE